MSAKIGDRQIHAALLFQFLHDREHFQFACLVQSVTALTLHGGHALCQHLTHPLFAKALHFLPTDLPCGRDGRLNAAATPQQFQIGRTGNAVEKLLLPISAKEEVSVGVHEAGNDCLLSGIHAAIHLCQRVFPEHLFLTAHCTDYAVLCIHCRIGEHPKLAHLLAPACGSPQRRGKLPDVVYHGFHIAAPSFRSVIMRQCCAWSAVPFPEPPVR